MFTKFRVRNFKTHLDTEIELKDLTLLIGSNNSGKTNLLKAISFFSDFINKQKYNKLEKYITAKKYMENKHHLSDSLMPIIFNCEWISSYRNNIRINYELSFLYNVELSYIESFTITDDNDIEKFDNEGKKLSIYNSIKESEHKYLEDIDIFFRQLESMKYYSFQPNAIKGQSNKKDKELNAWVNIANSKVGTRPIGLPFAFMLGKEGEYFFDVVTYVKEIQPTQYNKFISYLRRFESSFIGIDIKDDIIKWQFDTGKGDLASYDSADISDGLLKAAAVALLCASEKKPAVIMLEEIENGINQSKIQEFLGWLKHVSDNGKNTQFILTSHSPSVIREFSDNLDSVYTVHLKRKKGYVSEVTNLNEALKMINRLGGLKEETVEEVDGVLHIRKYALTELFYDGILGEL